MTEERDEVSAMVGDLQAPTLDPAFAARVRAISMAAFARSPGEAGLTASLAERLGAAVVPGLLLSAAALVLMRSTVVGLLDAAERVVPSLTPDALADARPAMRPLP